MMGEKEMDDCIQTEVESQEVEQMMVKRLLRRMLRFLRKVQFKGSKEYWEKHYSVGGNSGEGSYGKLAKFKAEIVNSFVKNNNINSIIEFGCGDGNQLSFFDFPNYIGLDVSRTAIKLCIEHFKNDKTKSFFLYEPENFENNHFKSKAELGLSLDVIFHLVEDEIFELYMKHLFLSSDKFVIIYSSNINTKQGVHERHRQFTKWVEINLPEWKLIKKIKNKYRMPDMKLLKIVNENYDFGKPIDESCADFFIYEIRAPPS